MRHRGWSSLLRLGIVISTLALTWILLREIGWSEVIAHTRSARTGSLLLAVAALAARSLLLFARWTVSLRLLGISTFHGFLLAAQLAAIFINHVTPSARLLGGVLRARYFGQRYAVSFADAYGVVLIDQTAHQVVQSLLTWLALIALVWSVGLPVAAGILTLSLLALAAALLFWSRRRRRTSTGRPIASLMARWIERRARRLGPLVAGGRSIADRLRTAFARPRLQLRLAVLATAIVGTSALAQWLVFRSLGVDVGWLTILIVVTVGVAAGVVTGTPGGVASTEAAMIAAYVALAVPAVDAAAGTLVYRGLHYGVVVVLGLPSFVYCEVASARALRARAPSDREDSTGAAPPAPESRSDPDG